MRFDTQSMFSDRQAITASTVSTNVIDLGTPGTPQHAAAPITQDIGRGRPIDFLFQVVEGFNNLTSLAVTLQISDTEDFSSTTVVWSNTLTLAELIAGAKLPFRYLPRGLNQRYMRLNYVVTGTAPTAGAVIAGVVTDDADWSA